MAPSSCVLPVALMPRCRLPYRSHRLSLQRDERVLVVWAYDADQIIPTCNDFEQKLIKMVWSKRALFAPATVNASQAPSATNSTADLNEKAAAEPAPGAEKEVKHGKKRSSIWGLGYFVSKSNDVEKTAVGPSERPMRMLAPFWAGLATAMSFCGSLLVPPRWLRTLTLGLNSLHRKWHSDPDHRDRAGRDIHPIRATGYRAFLVLYLSGELVFARFDRWRASES